MKVDRFVLILSVLGLAGILAGFWGLRSSDQIRASATTEKIARIDVSSNDSRLRRSGDFKWVKVAGKTDCYENDRIFTGPDSTVTIEYESGTRITLLPNSLISLSRGTISLETGSIEINVKKGPFGLKALGETLTLSPLEHIRVVDSGEVKKFVALSENTKSLKDSKLLAEETPESLLLVSPPLGENLPFFPELKQNFTWKHNRTQSTRNYRFEIFSESDNNRPLLSRTLPASTISIPLSGLVSGNLTWKVTDLDSHITSSSTFFLDPDVNATLLVPARDTSWPFNLASSEGITFEWKSRPEYSQRFQIAEDPEFQSVLIDETPTEAKTTFRSQKAGNYFWRVGHVLNPKIVSWSEVSTFSVKELPILRPISLLIPEQPLDFALNPVSNLRWSDPNKCPTYQLSLRQKDALILEKTLTVRTFPLPELKDGSYELALLGRLEDGREVRTSGVITVKNSPPVPAPVIKNKKNVRLFVLLRKLMGFIISDATAAESFYTLKWDGIPDAEYELEIIREDNSVVVKELTRETSYRFIIPGPEKFFWRIRTKLGNRWSAFSERADIEILDKVTLEKDVLMLTPKNNEVMTVNSDVKSFLVSWNKLEGYEDYFLEVFGSANSKKASFTTTVRGTSFLLTFGIVPRRFYWRVTAVSSFGNRSVAPVPFIVNIARRPEVPIRYQLQPALLFSRTSFNQDYQGDAEIQGAASFSGPAINVSGEYFLKKYNHHRSFAFEGRYGDFKNGMDELTDARLLLEYGWLSDPFGKETHNFHLGYLLHTIDFKFGENLSSAYAINFVSGKYSYIRIWSKKSLLEFTTSLMFTMPQNDLTPSFLIKPVYHHRLSKNWWAIGLAMFERYSATGAVKVNSEKADMTVSVQNISVGVGLSYRPE